MVSGLTAKIPAKKGIQMLRNLKVIPNGNYTLTENYGGLKEGTPLKIIGSTPDSYLISWRGKPLYLPESLVTLERPNQPKPRRKQNEYTRN